MSEQIKSKNSMKNPYDNLPKTAFWKSGVAESSPSNIDGIYNKKWHIDPDWNIATAGSCFAQHITHFLRKNGFNVLDMELPPPGLPIGEHKKYGYSMYSCRYGNVYTIHQLLQLIREVSGDFVPVDIEWERDGKYFDALRPAVEPDGLDSVEELRMLRKYHLSRVLKMFQIMDVFIFTLGLTEAWIHKESGTIYSTAPGVIAGNFDDNVFAFKNFKFQEIIEAFYRFQESLLKLRPNGKLPKILLTVSPVPLTATAGREHVLQASTYSKSILRSVAGQLASENSHIDYFPSFEIITNQRAQGSFFEANFRTVKQEAIASVMKVFFAEHGVAKNLSNAPDLSFTQISVEDAQCEEVLLEAFGK